MADLATLAKLQRLRELQGYLWFCDRQGCDGRPHAGRPFPHARKEQVPPPGDWLTWLILAGRGFGKTRAGAEYVKERMLAQPGHRVAVIVPRFADGRDVCVEGESGLQAILPPDRIKTWNRSQGVLTLTNLSRLKIFGTETEKDAEKLRGPQHHTLWVEELASQRYGGYALDMALFGLRLGDDVRCVITTTPKPIKVIREQVADDDTVITKGSTYDNKDNLAPKILAKLKKKYEGSRLGKQELHAELLDDTEGALFTQALIERARISAKKLPQLTRVVVAVDPAVTSKKTSDETGIIVAGRSGDDFYVLDDRSGLMSPNDWATEIVETFNRHKAGRVVAEVNNGGDLIELALKSAVTRKGVTGRNIPYRKIHATRGKALRAEPVQALYEQGRVHHVGMYGELEDEMTTWVPPEPGEPVGDSPNRLDALVYAITDLAGFAGRKLGNIGSR